MTNRYDLHGADTAPLTAPPLGTRSSSLRPVLWVLLVLSAAANSVATHAGLNVLVGIGFGLLSVACVTGLVVDHYAHRSR